MAAILQTVGNVITRLSMDRFGWNLCGRIPSCPPHVHHDAVAMATAVAWQRTAVAWQRHGTFNIHKIYESVGRTREPILIKFGTQQHVRTAMTVT